MARTTGRSVTRSLDALDDIPPIVAIIWRMPDARRITDMTDMPTSAGRPPRSVGDRSREPDRPRRTRLWGSVIGLAVRHYHGAGQPVYPATCLGLRGGAFTMWARLPKSIAFHLPIVAIRVPHGISVLPCDPRPARHDPGLTRFLHGLPVGIRDAATVAAGHAAAGAGAAANCDVASCDGKCDDDPCRPRPGEGDDDGQPYRVLRGLIPGRTTPKPRERKSR